MQKVTKEYQNARSFVAERFMEFKRGNCQGTIGGGNAGSAGINTWVYCEWCGYKIENGKTRPCPKYPFPNFTFIELMRKLGEGGIHLIVRYDKFRKENRFTIIGPEGRMCDTDEPFRDLCAHLVHRYVGCSIDECPICGQPEAEHKILYECPRENQE